MTELTREKRKELGVFYTPSDLCQVLSDWVVRSPSDKVLEPSFGGCGFLESTIKSLEQLGNVTPLKSVYGADIDPNAFNYLSQKVGGLTDVNISNFVLEDFLKLKLSDFSTTKFDAVIGNPPYVSLHNMSLEQRESCFEILKESQYVRKSIGRNASLWAYFILHSLSFLKNGGRAAWVLPSSLLHAEYAKETIGVYRSHFKNIKIVKLYERYFRDSGADEISIILLADGFEKVASDGCSVSYTFSEDIESIVRNIEGEVTLGIDENYRHSLISENCKRYLRDCKERSLVKQFGEVAKIRIGMVTGHNKYFVVNGEDIKNNGIALHDTGLVVSKFSQLNGVFHNKNRHKVLIDKNDRCLLINPTKINRKNSNIRKYLARISKENRKRNRTFKKRLDWYAPDDFLYPDAFVSYMVHHGPRVVVNCSNINCTNSIHRAYFLNKYTALQKKSIACLMLSSITKLTAELEGKVYGSGVLKLEPSAIKKLDLFYSDDLVEEVSKYVKELDQLLLEDKEYEATFLVNRIISRSMNIPMAVFKEFQLAVELLREDRYRGLKK